MKIAVIGAKGLPPKQGGIEHYCAEVYPRMVAQGHSVDLFARSSYIDLAPFQKADFKGVRIISVPCPGARGYDAFIGSALGAIAACGRQYDIIHFHALGPSLFTWLPKYLSSAKVIATCQGLDWQREKWGKISSRMIRLGEATAAHCADGITVVSEDLRSYFLKTYSRQSFYIPNAPASYADSDPDFTYGQSLSLEQGKYIVFLGRLVPEKCPDLLLKAFQKLQPPDWKLVFVGGTSDTTDFIDAELLQPSTNNPNIIFTGELRGSQLAEIVRGAGLFALPSSLEGLPLAMLEAMAEGIPILASDIPPHVQLLGEERDRGVLFQMGNLTSCVESMNWAIHHPQEMRVMAEKSQKYVQLNYNWDQITADTLKVYQASLGALKQSSTDTLEQVVLGKQ